MSGGLCTTDFEKSFVVVPMAPFPGASCSLGWVWRWARRFAQRKMKKIRQEVRRILLIKRKRNKNVKKIKVRLCMSPLSSPLPERGAEPINPPIIYIASAYSGDIEANVEKTKEYSRRVIRSGGVPFNPILNLHGVLNEESDRDTAINLDLSLMKRCDELWVFGEPTADMEIEITKAERIGMTIRRFAGEMEEIYEDRWKQH